MKYFLHYDKENNIIGYGTMPTTCPNYECREVSEQEYNDYQAILEAKKKIADKLNELTNWFDNYFDKQLTQSQWQDDFAVSHDDYFNKDYASIDELKAQAKLVRNEIRELRENV